MLNTFDKQGIYPKNPQEILEHTKSLYKVLKPLDEENIIFYRDSYLYMRIMLLSYAKQHIHIQLPKTIQGKIDALNALQLKNLWISSKYFPFQKELQKLKIANEDFINQLQEKATLLNRDRKLIKYYISILNTMQDSAMQNHTAIQDRLKALKAYKQRQDNALKAYNAFIRQLNMELNGDERRNTAYLHTDQYTVKDLYLHKGKPDNRYAQDSALQCIVQIVHLYHPERDITKVYHQIANLTCAAREWIENGMVGDIDIEDWDHALIKNGGDMMPLETLEIASCINQNKILSMHSQTNQDICYIHLKDFTVEYLQNYLKMKDEYTKNVPVMLAISKIMPLYDNFQSYHYTSTNQDMCWVVVRLNDDETYDLWTPHEHITLAELEPLYELSYRDDTRENLAIVPVTLKEYLSYIEKMEENVKQA